MSDSLGCLADIPLPAFVSQLTHTHLDAVKPLGQQQEEEEGGAGGLKTPCFFWLRPHLDNLVLGWAEEEPTGSAGPFVCLHFVRLSLFDPRPAENVLISKLSRVKAMTEWFFGHRLVTSGFVCVKPLTRRTVHEACSLNKVCADEQACSAQKKLYPFFFRSNFCRTIAFCSSSNSPLTALHGEKHQPLLHLPCKYLPLS